jgi:hypothetical protein
LFKLPSAIISQLPLSLIVTNVPRDQVQTFLLYMNTLELLL